MVKTKQNYEIKFFCLFQLLLQNVVLQMGYLRVCIGSYSYIIIL